MNLRALAGSALEIRADLVESEEAAWRAIAGPGTWLTGAERAGGGVHHHHHRHEADGLDVLAFAHAEREHARDPRRRQATGVARHAMHEFHARGG